MAYNDSGELPVSQSTYSLGGYTFELKVQTVHEPGEPDVVSVYAICRGPDGTRETQAVDYPEGTTVESWSVECNETEASVYASIKSVGKIKSNVSYGDFLDEISYRNTIRDFYYYGTGDAYYAGVVQGPITHGPLIIAESAEGGKYRVIEGASTIDVDASSYVTYEDKAYYYNSGRWLPEGGGPAVPDTVLSILPHIIGTGAEDDLIARFAIDIREADTDSWDEPGNDGPPGTTLYVTVTGATAGSCIGTPADNETVKGYGDGGDGGYGGGGGAGASAVIIYDFATSLADSVVQEAISRGPGSGGPGGKGGKGGDGCILIFY